MRAWDKHILPLDCFVKELEKVFPNIVDREMTNNNARNDLSFAGLVRHYGNIHLSKSVSHKLKLRALNDIVDHLRKTLDYRPKHYQPIELGMDPDRMVLDYMILVGRFRLIYYLGDRESLIREGPAYDDIKIGYDISNALLDDEQ